jgi:pSer/pThr/pTyr-binding forkhead associated (FHA) protein
MTSLLSGSRAGRGTYRCERCAHVVSLPTDDVLPPCPQCQGRSFAQDSMFAETTIQQPLVEPDEDAAAEAIGGVRDSISSPGQYIAYKDGDRDATFSITGEYFRIGRSLGADIRFDDPTVSRRHALIVRRADGLRVVDDRSLNGVFVNGERVDSSLLSDGDEIQIGRHKLRFVEVADVDLDGSAPAGTGAPVAQ